MMLYIKLRCSCAGELSSLPPHLRRFGTNWHRTLSPLAVCKKGESAGEHRHTGVEVREQNMIA
jgi:hypothetical protein